MGKAWKTAGLLVALVLVGLCGGFPIGLESSAADYHTQFLTGLVGILLTVCGIVFLAGCLCCQKKNGFKEFHNNPVVVSSTSSLDHGHINPIANGEFTIFTPLSPPHHNNNVFLANEQIVGQTEIDYNHADIDVRSWFDGTEKNFPRTKLKYIRELGKGWFGRVVEGTAQGLSGSDDQSWTPVAVRILEASATSSERAIFLHDAVIYRYGKHPHILQLLGRSLESVPLLLLQELCPLGDLKKYLRNNRENAEVLLSGDLPLSWCCQLSSALEHLHHNKLTHPDLATRNCQVVSDLSLRLGDYGLAASLYPEDYYQGAPAVPVRWCAPESLTYTSTTIQPKPVTFDGNIWSLGVTMWEIYQCGAQPYAHLSDDDVISQVLGSPGVRLPKPNISVFYIDCIFRLIQMCWFAFESRPSISEVHLMLTDLMKVYQKNKHVTHSEMLVSMQDFDKRWDCFKPNSVARTDNHDFSQEGVAMADVDLSDVTLLNLSLGKEEELLNAKIMSPSLNNLHGSLDNLAAVEMDSWLQKVATKTGDMSYVRGLSEAIKDLDNTLALENVSSSDSSHQPSPGPENASQPTSKLEFQLETDAKVPDDSIKTQHSSLTESVQRTSSESETEDEHWKRKIETGAYSEKVHQKSKSVTDLMVLTHIDCSESDSETPLPSLDYRVNYKNVRYIPRQNLENVSLMFGSEGNLLSVHDKFQEELRRLQEERKDSLLFVPESVSHNSEKLCAKEDLVGDSESSLEETPATAETKEAACTYVNISPVVTAAKRQTNILQSPSTSHRNPESLIDELSSPTEIQPGNQVYNVFNVTVDSSFSPLHIRTNLSDIICYKDTNLTTLSSEANQIVEVKEDIASEFPTQSFQVPKLMDIIQNNDDLMDYIISKYEPQEDAKTTIISEEEKNASTSIEEIIQITIEFLENERRDCVKPGVQFDVSSTQEEVLPSSMTHSALFTSTPFRKGSLQNYSPENLDVNYKNASEALQFSSNFTSFSPEEATPEMKYSLETWDSFLGKTMTNSQDCRGFDEFSSEPQSLLFLEGSPAVDTKTVECKNEALIETFDKPSEESDLGLQDLVNTEENVDGEELHEEQDLNLKCENDVHVEEQLNETYTKESEDASNGSSWEPGEGWFLHPQVNSEVSGQMEVAQGGEESYVGFSMDDEIMAAIRNELLMKLPQAQGQSSNTEPIKDPEEWESEGRSEVLIKYNVYTTPLSPIPEESFSENDSYHLIYNRESSSDSENEDWPKPYEEPVSALADTETHSVQNADSPMHEPQNRHTPSQDSCCSNDTLFNLEELAYGLAESDSMKLSSEANKEAINVTIELAKKINEEEEKDESDEENKLCLEVQDSNKGISKADVELEVVNESVDPAENPNFNVTLTLSEDDNECDEVLQLNQTYEVSKDDAAENDVRIEMSNIDNISDVSTNNIVEEQNDVQTINKEELQSTDNEKHVDSDNQSKNREDILIEPEIHSNDVESNLQENKDEVFTNSSLNNLEVFENINSDVIVGFCDVTFNLGSNETDEDLDVISEDENELQIEKKSCSDHSSHEVETKRNNYRENMEQFPIIEELVLTKDIEIKTNGFVSKSCIDEGDINLILDDCDVKQDIHVLNIKNIQNGVVLDSALKWTDQKASAKKSDVNVMDMLGSSCNDCDKILELTKLESVDDQGVVELEKTVEIEDFTYLTNFLNHERQNVSDEHMSAISERDYVNVNDITVTLDPSADSTGYVNTNELLNITAMADKDYVNIDDCQNYVDANELSNLKRFSSNSVQPDYVNIARNENVEEHLYDPVADDNVDLDVYDALTDIRFTGPTDIQLMSTSFSESADIDEQDWDSGSDTRSSSSGEFIWKEGEHEESVKALRAAPQDPMSSEKVAPMDDIDEGSSESSDEDEEADSPEFVPSAWDKYATPTKSALRSPEKTLERSDSDVKHKKSKGVWFKKQKYHCVYEYPREPESPNINSYELWQPVPASVIEWEVNTSPYITNIDATDSTSECYQPLDKHARNLYHLADFTSGMTALDDEFFISSTAKPFESFGGLSSQFFPGQAAPSDQWTDLTKQPSDNVTPDSGVEDITPASNIDSSELPQVTSRPQVQSLKLLAAAAVKQVQAGDSKSTGKDALGGLRHARNKLKLDLPPSPSAFTSTKAFTIEPPEELVTKREVPTFTTFGKSRFLVQHVDTPTCEQNEAKNVSFEALPYKPLQVKEDKAKVEMVRGEASLLDSADEDSGIESSTLERKKVPNIFD